MAPEHIFEVTSGKYVVLVVLNWAKRKHLAINVIILSLYLHVA